MKLSSIPREKLVQILTHLYGESVSMGLPTSFLDSIDSQISLCEGEYKRQNMQMKFVDGNDRYPGSLAGEVASYIRALHLWKTLPPWTNIEVAHDKERQVNQCVDLVVGENTEQIKSGIERSSQGIYYHVDWLKGIPHYVVAVCWPKRVFHVNKRDEWIRLSSQYHKWIDRDAFLENGTIEPIHPDIVKLIEELL